MSFTCSLFSDKVRCFNQSKRALYGNFIIKIILKKIEQGLSIKGVDRPTRLLWFVVFVHLCKLYSRLHWPRYR